MVGFQFDQVGVALVTAFIMPVTWCVYQYLRHKTFASRQIQTINMKKIAETQKSQVTTSYSQRQTETMKFTERLTNFGDKVLDSADKFYKSCETCEEVIGNEAVGFCKMCEKYMCINCCQHHEKIPLSKNHVLLGKEVFKGVRNKKKLFDKSFVLLQNYRFNECNSTWCKNNPTLCCKSDHNIQPLCLTKNVADKLDSIRCFVKKFKNSHQLAFQWENKILRQSFQEKIMEKNLTPADICTETNSIFGWYFTIPKEQMICKYTKDADVDFFGTSGACHGIAVFNEGLAISIYIPTNYSLLEWQVQFISLNGALRRQICFDNDWGPLFKEPKHLTSNDAQDILFISDQGNHSIIALDTKGYILFKYTHETIKNPLGLTCDDEGNIYVTSGNKVVQIDQHGTKSRVILSSKETIKNVKLIDVCYNKFTNELGLLSESANVTILKPVP